jgi:hypothetical protein
MLYLISIVKGYGIKGIRCIPPLQPMHGANNNNNNSESTQEQLDCIRRRVGEIQVAAAEDGKLELDYTAYVGKRDGGEAERYNELQR